MRPTHWPVGRPAAVIWAYWQEVVDLEIGAVLLPPVHIYQSIIKIYQIDNSNLDPAKGTL